jgi:hypothetical protein
MGELLEVFEVGDSLVACKDTVDTLQPEVIVGEEIALVSQ